LVIVGMLIEEACKVPTARTWQLRNTPCKYGRAHIGTGRQATTASPSQSSPATAAAT
jgi:hypothetical protein